MPVNRKIFFLKSNTYKVPGLIQVKIHKTMTYFPDLGVTNSNGETPRSQEISSFFTLKADSSLLPTLPLTIASL